MFYVLCFKFSRLFSHCLSSVCFISYITYSAILVRTNVVIHTYNNYQQDSVCFIGRMRKSVVYRQPGLKHDALVLVSEFGRTTRKCALAELRLYRYASD